MGFGADGSKWPGMGHRTLRPMLWAPWPKPLHLQVICHVTRIRLAGHGAHGVSALFWSHFGLSLACLGPVWPQEDQHLGPKFSGFGGLMHVLNVSPNSGPVRIFVLEILKLG